MAFTALLGKEIDDWTFVTDIHKSWVDFYVNYYLNVIVSVFWLTSINVVILLLMSVDPYVTVATLDDDKSILEK